MRGKEKPLNFKDSILVLTSRAKTIDFEFEAVLTCSAQNVFNKKGFRFNGLVYRTRFSPEFGLTGPSAKFFAEIKSKISGGNIVKKPPGRTAQIF